jgi:hypothetical protein
MTIAAAGGQSANRFAGERVGRLIAAPDRNKWQMPANIR